MSIVLAKFDDGVFRPVGPVNLPNHCEVVFEPEVVMPSMTPEALDRIYTIMSRRHHSGEADVAARHNEHQPLS